MGQRLAFAAITALSLSARAAYADGDPDGAKKHFEAGRAARDAGDCPKAITEFEASIAADKSIGAYYNLGFCQEQLGRRQDAYNAYRTARDIATARNDPRLKEITGAVDALLQTPNVRLTLPQSLPAGLQIFVDGELVPATFYASEMTVFTKAQPAHDVHVTAPGYKDVNAKVESRAVKAIELEPATTPYTLQTTPPPPPANDGGIRAQHIGGAAAVLGGVALDAIGIAVTADYLARRSTLKSDVERAAQQGHCTTSNEHPTCPTVAAVDAYDAAIASYNHRVSKWRSAEAPAIISMAVGTLAIAGGAYLLWTAPPIGGDKPAPSANVKPGFRAMLVPAVGPTYQGLSLAGTF